MNFEDLKRDQTPPEELENRVAAELRRRGLLKQRGHRYRAAIAAAAALVIGLLAGEVHGRASASPPRPAAAGMYMLLLHGESSLRDSVNEHRRWARDLYAAGQLAGGQKLNDAARFIGAAHGSEQVTGYFVVRADSLDAAVRIAESCPHARHGGSIEIRPIDKT